MENQTAKEGKAMRQLLAHLTILGTIIAFLINNIKKILLPVSILDK